MIATVSSTRAPTDQVNRQSLASVGRARLLLLIGAYLPKPQPTTSKIEEFLWMFDVPMFHDYFSLPCQ